MDKNILKQRKEFKNIKVHLSDIRYKKIYLILKNIEKKKVLEIGCSSGEFLELLKRGGWNVNGLELSTDTVKKAKEKGLDVSVHDANKKLPFLDKSFDVIIAGEVIEHLFDGLGFLDECHRVLKEKGILIVTTPNLVSLKNRILMLFGFDPRYALADFHYQVYTPRIIKKLYEKSKFKQTKLKGNFIIYSSAREKFFGTIFEKMAEKMPELAEHFIIISKK